MFPANSLRIEIYRVLVRYFKLPRIENHLRVTAGTDDEMQEFIRQLEAILSGSP